MNTKISKVISETVFGPSVKEHRNQLIVFFDDGESIKYDFYNEKLLKDATRNINYLRLFRDEFVFDCKEKVNLLHLFYTSYVQAYNQFRKITFAIFVNDYLIATFIFIKRFICYRLNY